MMAHPVISLERRLSVLLAPWARVAPAEDVPVTRLALNSADVAPRALFLAVAGTRAHGLEFVGDALARGAAAVAWEPARSVDSREAARLCAEHGVPLVEVEQLSLRVSEIAGRFYGEPSRALRVVGVTGTDGKTSVSHFIAQALNRDDKPCGVIGTLGYGLYGDLNEATHTTPDAVRVQGLLAAMGSAGAAFAAMEVSSHALVQGRVEALRFEVAVLTNLSRDHLDYHGTEAAYADAKARLFRLPGLRHAVVNADDAFGRRVATELPHGVKLWRYSLQPGAEAEVVCTRLEQSADGLELTFETVAGPVSLSVPLYGRFNAANVAAALSALLALGFGVREAGTRLAGTRPVPGRMERLGGAGRPRVIVDYAHTPAALAAALEAVRGHGCGRIWCVFGCGGDRDPGKRPEMGRVATEQADYVILTDDNPRGEAAERIVADILAGCEGVVPTVIHDRAAAIRHAVRQAAPADCVLVAGKGHETYQLIGERRLAFDDREAVRAALQERT